MDARQFFDEVVKLRRFQKDYFQTRSSLALRASKRQEKLIDDEIGRVDRLIKGKETSKLFGYETDK